MRLSGGEIEIEKEGKGLRRGGGGRLRKGEEEKVLSQEKAEDKFSLSRPPIPALTSYFKTFS